MAYKIAIIVGSLRKDSLNRKIARSICALRNDNLDCSMVEIGDLPHFDQDLESDPPAEWLRLRDILAEIAADETYWREIQRAFDLDRTMINLNNGGCSPAPSHARRAIRRRPSRCRGGRRS